MTKSIRGKINTSSIRIRKISPISPLSPVPQNHEGNLDNFAGDTLNTGGIISPVTKISPVRDSENCTQNSDIGDTGDTGGIFFTEENRVMDV